MTEQFLTLSDAATFTGVSRSTLRRFVENIVQDTESVNRESVLPTIEEVTDLKASKKPFSWRVSRELLQEEFGRKGQSAPKPKSDADRIVTVLEQTVQVLQDELLAKNKQIQQFQERQREQHILLQNMQQQLVSPASESELSEHDEQPDIKRRHGLMARLLRI